MVRNAGKFGKPKRGGKKQFTQNLAESDRAGMWDGEAKGSESEESSEESEDSEEEESGAEELNSKLASTSLGSSSKPQEDSSITQTRAERKAAKKQAAGKSTKTGNDGEDSDDDDQDLGLGNSNRVVKKAVKINEISNLDTGTLNRKEREAAEKKAAQERYWKLHQAGKTDEAKVDLARLAKIRQEREQAAAFRKAEAEAKAKEAADRAALSGRKKK
ncbi:hypothetical protein PGT21_029644 [Puccinia graminis f. sp. tritici]|uniref:Casein kinase substrate phosphoprotein PP28 domain-containing protein n=2 Tax=Puccinia graminis f. sp. tritici TaxID=56615 RepID=A0A5B0RBD9_PUCGR|nr:hypothetical protein PGT21_029644 [Puccinia graminis f. sp. tritici]KAA1122672.1 hypothetical protein PGTUg99_004874 [Puccinia graminis f. sp. tritici]